MILVSVLMSVFNTRIEYLKESVESICSQEFDEFEFIIVNDGSTDKKIIELLENYAKKYNKIRIIENENNIGLTKSLNKGVRASKGKYIVRMDSDDISCPDRIGKQFAYMEQHPEIDILGTDIKKIGDMSIHFAKFKNYMDNDSIFRAKMMFNNVGPIHPTVMIRKSSIFEKGILYREDIIKAQDYALWIDCLNAGAKFACLNEKLLLYRIHTNQITIKKSDEQLKYKEMLIQENLVNQYEINIKGAEVLSTLYTNTFEYPPSKYVFWIKDINLQYASKLMEMELKERWLHKVAKCIRYSNDYRGLKQIYTYKCIFSKSLFKWLKNSI